MSKTTKLLEQLYNQELFEAINQPIEDIFVMHSTTLHLMRYGREIKLSLYSDSKVEVSYDNEVSCNIILTDYCKTKEDLVNMFKIVDDIISRVPNKKE